MCIVLLLGGENIALYIYVLCIFIHLNDGLNDDLNIGFSNGFNNDLNDNLNNGSKNWALIYVFLAGDG